MEVEADLDMSISDLSVGGGGQMELREVLTDVSPGDALFRVREVGDDPPYGKYPGGFPPPGGAMDHETTPPGTIRPELALS